MKNKVFLIFLIHVVISFILSQNSHQINKNNYYNKIAFFSNNYLTAKATTHRRNINTLTNNSELGCFANDNIQAGEAILKIPKKFSLCPYNLFPFKFELFSYIMEIPGMRETIGQQQRISIILNSYYVMYYLYAQKDEIKNYIQEKKIKNYYNLDEVDESLRDSFPDNTFDLSQEHLMLLKNLGYPFAMDMELENIFNFVKNKINSSPNAEVILPWTANFKNFKKAFYLLMNRGVTIKYDDYKILKGEDSKKNSELNKIIGKNFGGLCLVSYIDLCNHYQSKYEDMRDKKSIIITTSKDYINIFTENNYYLGQEVSFTYINDPSNLVLYYRYGMVLHPNIFNVAKVKVEDNEKLNNFQYDLCRELGCVDSFVKDSTKIPLIKEYALRYSSLDSSLLNYARVKYYNEVSKDVNTVLKQFFNKEFFSFENEISASTFYYNSVLISFTNRNQEKTDYEGLIGEIQNFRNKQKLSPSKKEIINYKIFEDIYTMDLSYKIIIQRHLMGSLNNLIANTHKDLLNIKSKYIN